MKINMGYPTIQNKNAALINYITYQANSPLFAPLFLLANPIKRTVRLVAIERCGDFFSPLESLCHVFNSSLI